MALSIDQQPTGGMLSLDVLTNAHVEKSTNSRTPLPTANHLCNNLHSFPLKPVIIDDDDGDGLASIRGFDYISSKRLNQAKVQPFW